MPRAFKWALPKKFLPMNYIYYIRIYCYASMIESDTNKKTKQTGPYDTLTPADFLGPGVMSPQATIHHVVYLHGLELSSNNSLNNITWRWSDIIITGMHRYSRGVYIKCNVWVIMQRVSGILQKHRVMQSSTPFISYSQ